MKTVAFFSNKGGLGTTTLLYHLAHMLHRLGLPTLAVDLDPQADLTSAFYGDGLPDGLPTIHACIEPMLQGAGAAHPEPLRINNELWMIPGDLGLSVFEDIFAESWLKNDPGSLRVTSSFRRIIQEAGAATGASVALVDAGPSLGAIGRTALLAADDLVVTLAPDRFAPQSLQNLGSTLRKWRGRPLEASTAAPSPAGYVVLQHSSRVYRQWLDRIPLVYSEQVLGNNDPADHRLATIRTYPSLKSMAQEARKPMFDLSPADGAIGSHAELVRICEADFKNLALRIIGACGLTTPSHGGTVN